MPKARRSASASASAEAPPPAASLTRSTVSEDVDIGERPDDAARIAPRLEPNQPFVLLYHPTRWIVMSEGGHVALVPCPTQLQLQRGANAIDVDSRGNVRWREALPAIEQNGFTVIPSKAYQNRTYLKRCAVRGGWHYHLRFATPHAGVDYLTVDLPAYEAFWKDLFDQGVIERPPAHVFERMLEQARRRRLAVARKAASDPGYEAEFELAKAHVTVLEAELKRYAESADPIEGEDVDPLEGGG